MSGCEHDPEMFEYDGECMSCSITQLEAENAKLKEALETVRDAGLEPIDPAYRELARAALEGKEDG